MNSGPWTITAIITTTYSLRA